MLGIDSFFKKGQRKELFEFSDNQVSTINITISDEDFIKLKTIDITDDTTVDFKNDLEKRFQEVTKIISYLQICNFVDIYPNFNSKDFPELAIGVKGYAHFDFEKVIKGFKFYIDDYQEFSPYDDYDKTDLKLKVLQSNKNFKLLDILIGMATSSNFDDVSKYDSMTSDLVMFKFVSKKGEDYTFDESSYRTFYNTLKKDSEKSKMMKTTNQERIANKQLKNLNNIKKNVKRILHLLKSYTFSDDILSKYDFKTNHPELNINDKGMAIFSIENVMNGYNFDLEESIDLETDYIETLFSVLRDNEEFDLLTILMHLTNAMEFTTYKQDDELTRRLVIFNYVSRDEDGKYTVDIESMTAFIETYDPKEDDYSYYEFEDIDDLAYNNYFKDFDKSNFKIMREILETIKKYNFKANRHDLDAVKKRISRIRTWRRWCSNL